MLLNLDPNFTPYGPGVDFKSWMFSGGEIGFKLSVGEGLNTDSNDENYYNSITITTRLTSSDRTMELLMATDALRRRGFSDITLVCPYLPYARQDRVMVEGESLSLKVFCDLINGQEYSKVQVFDAHSDVSTALLNNVVNVSNHKFVEYVLTNHRAYIQAEKDNYWLCSPDAGALKKAYSLAKAVGYHDFGLVKCDKERDVSDGRILSTSVSRNDLNGWDVWICDDICEKATTFVKIAEQLRKRNCGKIYLIVSHGIFPAGYSLDGIDHVWCTDSFKSEHGDSKITVVKLDQNLLS